MFYRTSDPMVLSHNPFSAIVSPRPIAWISTQRQGGQINLSPYSFFNAVAYAPPQVIVSSVGAKDTLRNMQETGVMCINIAGYEDREALNC